MDLKADFGLKHAKRCQRITWFEFNTELLCTFPQWKQNEKLAVSYNKLPSAQLWQVMAFQGIYVTQRREMLKLQIFLCFPIPLSFRVMLLETEDFDFITWLLICTTAIKGKLNISVRYLAVAALISFLPYIFQNTFA